MTRIRVFLSLIACIVLGPGLAAGADAWVVYEDGEGPGRGKHIVFVTGDDEYRSEESVPPFARMLAVRHGFRCTVLFAINKDTGAIDPATMDNIPGLEALESADLMVLFLRFRALPDEQMERILAYTDSGKPILALRTSTHPFSYPGTLKSRYAKWNWTSSDPKGGYGREILGETWINHYGRHGQESTRGVIAPGMEDHPIVRGCEDIWGPSDVYGITELSGDSRPLVLGRVLSGMDPGDPPVPGKELLPVAWTKSHRGASGIVSRIFTTTMGHSYDFKNEGFRRLVVNAVYWCVGMEDLISERANVDFVGRYDPSDIGFGAHKVGVMPSMHDE